MRTYRGHTFTGFKVLALEKLKLSDKYEFGAPTGSYASLSGYTPTCGLFGNNNSR